MNTLKETYVKYTTKINSNNDKTINIKQLMVLMLLMYMMVILENLNIVIDHNSD